MSRRTFLSAGATAVLTLAGLGVAPSPAQAAAPTVTDVDQAGSQIRHLGELTYPDTYADVSVDETALTATLRVTQLGTATNALLAVAGSVPTTVVLVPRSYSALKAVQQQVLADVPTWAAQGITIAGVGADGGSDKVNVGIVDYTETAAAAVQLKYGIDNVIVTRGSIAAENNDSFHDTSPYNGGIAVNYFDGVQTHTCTASFGTHLRSSSTTSSGPYLMLAGHCFPNGAVVTHNGATIGKASRSTNLYYSGGTDAEVIVLNSGLGSSRLIWETNTSRARNDGGILYVARGTTVCKYGRTTGKTCGTVQAVDTCQPFSNGYTYCHLDTYKSASGTISAPGDSGGPVFSPYTYNSIRWDTAVGSVTGASTTDPTVGFYTEISAILDPYSVSINV